jgi:hypothetical protein
MKTTLFFIAAMALMVGCTKEGTQGPAGENGSNGLNGATGPAGPTGATGATGANGSGNIKTVIYTVTVSDWTAVTGGYGVELSDNYIADADSDNVDVALSFNPTGTWIGMPITNVETTGDQLIFEYANSVVTLYYFYTAAPTQTLYFKLTVIPPADARRRNGSGKGQLNSN